MSVEFDKLWTKTIDAIVLGILFSFVTLRYKVYSMLIIDFN